MQQPPSLPCAGGSNGIRSDTAHAAGDIQPPHESLVDELLDQLSPAQLQARSVHGQQASAMGSLLAVPMGLQQDQSSTTFTPFPAASATQFFGLQQQQQQLMQQMYTMRQTPSRSVATGSNSSRPDTTLVDSNSLCGPGTAVGFPADFPLPAPVHAPTALTDSLLAPCAAPQQQQSGPPLARSLEAAATMPVHSQRQLLVQQITAAAAAWQQPMPVHSQQQRLMCTMQQTPSHAFATGGNLQLNSSRLDTAFVSSNSLCTPGTAVRFPTDLTLAVPPPPPQQQQQQQSGPPFSSSRDAAASMPVHSQRQLLVQQITAAAAAWQQPMGLGMQLGMQPENACTTSSAPISRSSLL
jgi:hypothetical protein